MSTRTGCRRRATAAMKTTTLLGLLDLRGWAGVDLSKGARAALRGLAHCLPYGSGAGKTTRDQVCERMGYTDAGHVGRLLHELEAFGAIEWVRGGIYYGTHVPGRFTIRKDLLASLANAAIAPHLERAHAARAATRRRASRWRHCRLTSKKPHVLAVFAQVSQGQNPGPHGGESQHPLPLRGESLRGSHPTAVNSVRTTVATTTKAAVSTSKDNMTRLPAVCPHKDPDGPAHCALCRYGAMSPGRAPEPKPKRSPSPVEQVPTAPPHELPDELVGLSGPALARAALASILTRSRQ